MDAARAGEEKNKNQRAKDEQHTESIDKAKDVVCEADSLEAESTAGSKDVARKTKIRLGVKMGEEMGDA